MGTLGSARRYYLGKRKAAADRCDDDSEALWKGKQEAEPGTELPSDFTLRSRLSAAGYTAEEDLDGADVDELINAGFTQREAEAVITAFEALS